MTDGCCGKATGTLQVDHLLGRREDIELYPPGGLGTGGDAEGLWFYRPGQLLVASRDAEAVTAALGRLRVGICHTSRAQRGVVRLTVTARSDIDTLIRRVRQLAGRSVAITPNHVLFGAQGWLFDPAGDPDPVPPPDPVNDDDEVWAGISLAIVDTGLAADYASLELLDTGVSPGPDGALEDPDEDHDGLLDKQAGHGTFVAGVARERAPGVRIVGLRALDSDGTIDEFSLAGAIDELLQDDPTIVNLSLGGYTREDQPLLALRWLEELEDPPLIVAAAGNCGRSRPFFPAAMPPVFAVGAVEAIPVDEEIEVAETIDLVDTDSDDGEVAEEITIVTDIEMLADLYVRASFSNWGDWVDGCAIGVNIVSCFQSGVYRPVGGGPLLVFDGGAMWSGTSFATPRVAGAVADYQHDNSGTSARQALEAILADAPDGPPGLGKLIV